MNSPICLNKQNNRDSKIIRKSLTDILRDVHRHIEHNRDNINKSVSFGEFLIFLISFFIKKKRNSLSSEKDKL